MKQMEQKIPDRYSGRFVRSLWFIAGTFFLALGLIGIVIPLLPTTPFLLLATACYLRSSRKMYEWMLRNRLFGKYLQDYRDGKGISLRFKIATILLLWIIIGFSAFLVSKDVIINFILLAIAIGVTIHILRIRTKK